MSLTFHASTDAAIPLYLVDQDHLKAALATLSDAGQAWVAASGFTAGAGSAVAVPGSDGSPVAALVGFGTASSRQRHRFVLAGARAKLPAATYDLNIAHAPDADTSVETLGWLLAGYAFTRYRDVSGAPMAELVAPKGADAKRIETLAAAEGLTRDLINTPASDMGPDALEAAVSELASAHQATINVIRGDALLDENFPMIHAVGRAAAQEPRLIDMRWGAKGPRLTLVGKGVCFDTGGLNLKPGASMGLMKKDMGGAATVLGLAQAIMALDLPVQLRVLIPAVENSVSAPSFRPGDILPSRKGLTVEINNTDAEGRLVLGDALALASEEDPDLLISMATLTGAARVAVGPDLAPFYTDNDGDAAALTDAAPGAADPVWRMPFWTPYEPMIEPGIADLDNAPAGGFGGSITAALFLRRFAGDARYMHFDVYGWQPKPAPGRPKGGAGQGARAVLDALPAMLNL